MAGLPGVVGVQDNIALKPHAHVSAATVKAKIADALRRNASVEASRVNVEVNGDRIRLHGSVATWAERTQAAHAAWATPGVVHVENELHVTG